MLEGINNLVSAFAAMWSAIFSAPLFGALTWGYFIVACVIIEIFITYFIWRLK